MTDLEKLSKFSQEDVKRVSEEVWHEISRYCHHQTSTPKLYPYWWSTWRWKKHHNK